MVWSVTSPYSLRYISRPKAAGSDDDDGEDKGPRGSGHNKGAPRGSKGEARGSQEGVGRLRSV